MKVMIVSLSPDPSPARGEGRFVSRGRDFHINECACRHGTASGAPVGDSRSGCFPVGIARDALTFF